MTRVSLAFFHRSLPFQSRRVAVSRKRCFSRKNELKLARELPQQLHQRPILLYPLRISIRLPVVDKRRQSPQTAAHARRQTPAFLTPVSRVEAADSLDQAQATEFGPGPLSVRREMPYFSSMNFIVGTSSPAAFSSVRILAAACCWLRLPGKSSSTRSVTSWSDRMRRCRKSILVDSAIDLFTCLAGYLVGRAELLGQFLARNSVKGIPLRISYSDSVQQPCIKKHLHAIRICPPDLRGHQ